MNSKPGDSSGLAVKSHVGRDLLQSASTFKTEASVVWEYVVNSLQYVEKGHSARVNVQIDARRKRISISDNGMGMSAQGLRHYFTMHGENKERKAGRPGRGKFGTGKAAAFGIARTLRIDTVQDAKRNVVQLTREEISASNGAEIPVEVVVSDEPVRVASGTTVVIERIELAQIDTPSITNCIERHLSAFRNSNPEVVVNSHLCETREIPLAFSRTFKIDQQRAGIVGEIELTICAAVGPLSEELQGVAVTAGPGNLVGIERARDGAEGLRRLSVRECRCPVPRNVGLGD